MIFFLVAMSLVSVLAFWVDKKRNKAKVELEKEAWDKFVEMNASPKKASPNLRKAMLAYKESEIKTTNPMKIHGKILEIRIGMDLSPNGKHYATMVGIDEDGVMYVLNTFMVEE